MASDDADFQFMTTTILGQKVDSPLFRALEKAGIDDGADIASLPDRLIEQLNHQDNSSGNGTGTEDLGWGCQLLLRCFKALIIT
jgi:hypothetical protein